MGLYVSTGAPWVSQNQKGLIQGEVQTPRPPCLSRTDREGEIRAFKMPFCHSLLPKVQSCVNINLQTTFSEDLCQHCLYTFTVHYQWKKNAEIRQFNTFRLLAFSNLHIGFAAVTEWLWVWLVVRIYPQVSGFSIREG